MHVVVNYDFEEGDGGYFLTVILNRGGGGGGVINWTKKYESLENANLCLNFTKMYVN